MTLFADFESFKPPSVLVGLTLLCLAAHAVAAPLAPAWSPDIHLGFANQVVADEDAAYAQGQQVHTLNLGDLPDAADVDALQALPNGDVLFSLDVSVILGGAMYRPLDVIRFNGRDWSKELDGRAAGIPDGANIDAVTLASGMLIISLDVDALLNGIPFSDSDAIAYNGSAFSLFLSGASAGVPPGADVDALHYDSQGRLQISLDIGGVLGGIAYGDEDVLTWVPPSWSLQFDGSAVLAGWASADLDAWSVVPSLDLVFSNGFE